MSDPASPSPVPRATMPFFHSLTDIVTCSLSDLIGESEDPAAALAAVIAEMEEGKAGTARTVANAAATVTRLEGELAARRAEAERWRDEAKAAVLAGRDGDARTALVLKREAGDMAEAVEQELGQAKATHKHLQTTARALEARLSDARRKQSQLDSGQPVRWVEPLATDPAAPEDRASVDDELEALRRELGG